MKKILSLLLALILLLFSLPMSVFAEKDQGNGSSSISTEEYRITEKDPIGDLALDSQGVFLINTETETVLYSKNADARMFPASTTKILTALVVLREKPDLKKETITITNLSMFDYIIKDRGVHMGLKVGETFTLYDLLAGLMISSYCDVADLLAEYFGDGKIENFIAKMNATAQELGLENSNFKNAHGLHHPDHYSSPRDMSIILREAMKYDVFREIISLRNYSIPATEQNPARPLRHTVQSYSENGKYYLPCYVGGKSGYTAQAGRCLATYSEQDGVSYVSVLFGANMDGNQRYPGNMAEIETNTLISYAYENYALKTVFKKGQEVGKIAVRDSDQKLSVTTSESIRALVRTDAKPAYNITLPESISVKDVKNGKKIGSLNFKFNDSPVEDKVYSLVLSWDGKPIETKSALEKSAEGLSGIFREDKVFVTLFICLLLVVFITLPGLRLADYLHRRKSHTPKH